MVQKISLNRFSVSSVSRRVFAGWLAAVTIGATFASSSDVAHAQEKIVRIGYQKHGKLVLLKSKGTLEPKLKALGYQVEWKEFPSGPPLLEALNTGSVDFGNTGKTPPIFAQAAGAPLIYVAYEPPAPKGEAILVPKNSPLKSVTDLKGKKVALNKGSNVHVLLVNALEKAGVKYSEIQPIFLSPSDARAAFERGAVDAWVIWDPYQASAEAALEARVLADGVGADGKNIVANHQFHFSSRKFLETAENRKALDVVLEQLREVDVWAKTDIHAVAEKATSYRRAASGKYENARNFHLFDQREQNRCEIWKDCPQNSGCQTGQAEV